MTTVVKKEATKTSRHKIVPQYHVSELDQAFEITATMPGVATSALDLKLEDQWLKITGSSQDFHFEGFNKVHGEFGASDYEVGFKLPRGIEEGDISASMKAGMLKVVLPKSKQSLTRKIEVSAG